MLLAKVVRIRSAVANEDVVYQTIPAYSTTAIAGCLNAEVNVVAGDVLFTKITVAKGNGTISTTRTEFVAHHIGGAS